MYENEYINVFYYLNNVFCMLMYVYDVFYVFYDIIYIVIINGNFIFWWYFVIGKEYEG